MQNSFEIISLFYYRLSEERISSAGWQLFFFLLAEQDILIVYPYIHFNADGIYEFLERK